MNSKIYMANQVILRNSVIALLKVFTYILVINKTENSTEPNKAILKQFWAILSSDYLK